MYILAKFFENSLSLSCKITFVSNYPTPWFSMVCAIIVETIFVLHKKWYWYDCSLEIKFSLFLLTYIYLNDLICCEKSVDFNGRIIFVN